MSKKKSGPCLQRPPPASPLAHSDFGPSHWLTQAILEVASEVRFGS
jgi:hypothetical protein